MSYLTNVPQGIEPWPPHYSRGVLPITPRYLLKFKYFLWARGLQLSMSGFPDFIVDSNHRDIFLSIDFFVNSYWAIDKINKTSTLLLYLSRGDTTTPASQGLEPWTHRLIQNWDLNSNFLPFFIRVRINLFFCAR